MIKIGLLGAGHLGKIHLHLLQEIQAFDVVGFFDTNTENAALVAQKFGVKLFDSAEALMEACDAIDIVTPTSSHYQLASKAIKQHKHTFIEKPLVTTSEECKSLYQLAQEANVKVQVGYVERFNPAFITAIPYIKNPLFIESHRISEFHQRGTDVPVVLDMMIHDLDLIMHLIQSPVKKINATGVPVISTTPDIANARIEFDNGCVANLTASRIALNKERKTRIFQKDSYIEIDFLNKGVEITHLQDYKGEHLPLAVIMGTPDMNQKQVYIERPPVPEINAIKKELKGFANAINENTQPPVTIRDGYQSMDIAFQILDILKTQSDLLTQR